MLTRNQKIGLTAFLFVLFMNSQAEPIAVIKAIQSPVIIERADNRLAGYPGMNLESNDRILTGNNSRVLMALADNSIVKLGENVEFALKPSQDLSDNETFRATLDVIKGAFRFTTGLIAKYRSRDVTARINSITIGIRGTDVWGKSEPERDFVVLLEGNINIQRENEQEQVMDEAMTVFMAPTGQPAEAIVPVNPDDLSVWAQETELQTGQGISSDEGKLKLNLASYKNNAIAVERQSQLNRAGYPAELHEHVINDENWYRLSIDGINEPSDAESLKSALSGEFGFSSSWISQ